MNPIQFNAAPIVTPATPNTFILPFSCIARFNDGDVCADEYIEEFVNEFRLLVVAWTFGKDFKPVPITLVGPWSDDYIIIHDNGYASFSNGRFAEHYGQAINRIFEHQRACAQATSIEPQTVSDSL